MSVLHLFKGECKNLQELNLNGCTNINVSRMKNDFLASVGHFQ